MYIKYFIRFSHYFGKKKIFEEKPELITKQDVR